jgi:molecular chaperone GrpE
MAFRYPGKMKKDHKEKMNGAKSDNEGVHPDDEKLFDFDKETGAEQSVAPEESVQSGKVGELQAVVSELKDKHLRLLAEFDNYKKRTMRERLDLLNSASKEVMVSLLPVLDDFDRAKKSADDPNNEEVFSEGVSLVYNRLYNILQNLGLKAMTSTGEPFDVELHEAITEIPVPDESMKGKVIDTLEKGYTLNDKIIRHAKVVVGN